jgi:hypothetical protein
MTRELVSLMSITEEHGCFSSRKETEFAFLFLFALFRPSMDWIVPHPHID